MNLVSLHFCFNIVVIILSFMPNERSCIITKTSAWVCIYRWLTDVHLHPPSQLGNSKGVVA